VDIHLSRVAIRPSKVAILRNRVAIRPLDLIRLQVDMDSQIPINPRDIPAMHHNQVVTHRSRVDGHHHKAPAVTLHSRADILRSKGDIHLSRVATRHNRVDILRSRVAMHHSHRATQAVQSLVNRHLVLAEDQ
jgi:hypothetical protein